MEVSDYDRDEEIYLNELKGTLIRFDKGVEKALEAVLSLPKKRKLIRAGHVDSMGMKKPMYFAEPTLTEVTEAVELFVAAKRKPFFTTSQANFLTTANVEVGFQKERVYCYE